MQEKNCFRFLQDILVSLQQASIAVKQQASAGGPEAEARHDQPPRAVFRDLEECYLPRGVTDGKGASALEWELQLLPIETIVECKHHQQMCE